MSSKDIMILERIIEYCRQIQETCKRFGGYGFFTTDYVYRNAVCMCLLQIGELAGRLSEEAKQATPSIPWRLIRGLRNLCAHDYGALDFAQVWATVQEDIPTLQLACVDALDKLR